MWYYQNEKPTIPTTITPIRTPTADQTYPPDAQLGPTTTRPSSSRSGPAFHKDSENLKRLGGPRRRPCNTVMAFQAFSSAPARRTWALLTNVQPDIIVDLWWAVDSLTACVAVLYP
ncbi:hypothetical protein N7535_005332 [Penicillium sp. DV-2018c]|nr:hypothetical protein N7461_008913 [Penicillium sp. DV-2018c]KAJ5571672.1 hypothetical protein N7535_005332 [Penicillium sp. DV-2018c]